MFPHLFFGVFTLFLALLVIVYNSRTEVNVTFALVLYA